MECESMLFVNNFVPYLLDLSNSFFNSFIDFHSCEVVSWSDMRKKAWFSLATRAECKHKRKLKDQNVSFFCAWAYACVRLRCVKTKHYACAYACTYACVASENQA